jgi:hypothetical protein
MGTNRKGEGQDVGGRGAIDAVTLTWKGQGDGIVKQIYISTISLFR